MTHCKSTSPVFLKSEVSDKFPARNASALAGGNSITSLTNPDDLNVFLAIRILLCVLRN